MPISLVKNMDYRLGLKDYPDGFFDLLVADIPYGIGAPKMNFAKRTVMPAKQKNGGSLIVKRDAYAPKDWDNDVPGQAYFDEVRRVSKDQIIFGIDYVGWDGVEEGRVLWDKMMPDGVSFSRYERAYCSLIDYEMEIKFLWAGFQQGISADRPTTAQGNKKLNEKRIHPTQKPRALYQLLYRKFCKPGFKILDTHLGSGSSRIAAYKMGFDFWGFEVDEDYYTAAEARFLSEVSEPLFQSQ